MPKDDINYRFTENGIVYDFYDVFVPAENFRQPTLFTWGNNTSLGQLGINDTNTAPRSTPVTTFAGGTTWKSVSSAGAFTLAIKTDGTLWGWGRGNDGQFGNNALAARPTPVTTFAGGNNWKQVSTGGGLFTAAIKTDGSLWTFGQGSDDFSGSTLTGKLGTNDGARRATPVTTFAGGNNWKQVSCGGQFTSAIKTDGSLWTWGANNFGQLGINAGNVPRSTPVTTFAGGTDWKQVSCGSEHTIAIKTDGSLWIWGYNNAGQLGINDTTNRSTPVTTFSGGTTWKSVAGGYRFTTAIKTDGSLWTWGVNNNGQLGINNTNNRSTPVTTFTGGNNWKQVSVSGGQFTSAIKTDGSLWTWGLNTSGELGDNTIISRSTPVTTFAGGNNWKQVSGSSAIKYQPDP